MRYLNKIVFINSATIPYAEIQLDGNIHFIGTQGVGKSTVLRAILYFYNADSRKLGIPKGLTAKSFAEWYLSYANSYIIYEVTRETGAYCVVAFKSQNRVCFRFIDTAYNPDLFINQNNEAYRDWTSIREKLDAQRINVSSLVNGYDQYRDILYGNFDGKKEFRKYALLETKQYKNIYRTIQNVFLNTKLDANEIKQTIISSMEEEHISIDLEQYNHHLKGFETILNDIKRFRYPSVQRLAENAIEMLSAIRHINREQKELSGQLIYRFEQIEQQKPELNQKKKQQTEAYTTEQKSLEYEKNLFEKRKDKINDNISRINGKLKDAAKQKKYYNSINIDDLITRVSHNEEKKLELEALKNERTLLTNQFSDIDQKYHALINDQQHQFNIFSTQKENQKIELKEEEVAFLNKLNNDYEKLFNALEKEHENEIRLKENELSNKQADVHRLEKQKVSIKHTTLYAQEIALLTTDLNSEKLRHTETRNNITTCKQQIDTLQTKWNFEVENAEKNCQRNKEKIQLELEHFTQKKETIENNINRSKDSLYGWLNKNKPGWENTIGKVVNENLLFKDGLAPKLANDSSSLFGIKIDLNELDIQIKTIDDYQFELQKLEKKLELSKKNINELNTELEKDKENIQRRNLPKIKGLKEKIRQAEYECDQLKRRISKNELEKSQLIDRSEKDKSEALTNIQTEIDRAIVLKENAHKTLLAAKNKLRQNKENKQKEKTRRINTLKAETETTIALINQQIKEKYSFFEQNIIQLKHERNNELHNKGTDTKRLSEIEKQITTIDNELTFIEKNRDKVSDYNKDKRELFDKEKDFKNEINGLESKRTVLQNEYKITTDKSLLLLKKIGDQLKDIETKLNHFALDTEEYNNFSQAEAHEAFAENKALTTTIANDYTAVNIIKQITAKYYATIKKQEELRTSVDKFLANFSPDNILKFPEKLTETSAYINWAEELNDFIEEDKISEFEKRVNERFASIIHSVGKETTMLISKTGEIQKIIRKINNDFSRKQFLEAVTNIQLDIKDSKNTAVTLLKHIKEFNDENALSLGTTNLFSGTDNNKNNQKAVELLKQLIKEINQTKNTVIELSDSFELAFRIEENGNDTGWVEKLTNVGSEGTDVLVKAMINIMLLNVFKESASRKFKDFKLHCMMDEIGKLHPNNVKGILKFANERNILLINGSPTESTPLNYRHIYKISKDSQKQSKIKRIISNTTLH